MNANTVPETDAAPSGDAQTISNKAEAAEAPFASGAIEGYDGPQPVVKAREDHSISRRDIDPDALKVLYRLARNNFIAYLVGGGVRDLLLGRQPKDFDISTNAKPEQIRSLFRNCILIGRRFRLAHIRYGEKIIETSTFRSTPKQQADPADPDADLFQRDDNLFGSPAEDALRRDFTVNGLFYDIESFSIIDYVGGMEDLEARRIRSIGDPCIRFREDPVRMVRAVRFASRLDFSLDADTETAIRQYGAELTKASPARLLEEITRLFAFSSGEKAVRLLRSTGLLQVILPEVDACLDDEAVDHDLFWKRLRALDRGDTVLPDATPALIFAVLLNEPLKAHLGRGWTFDDTPRFRFDKLHAFLDPMAERLRFPRKLVDRIIHMYLNQNRFGANGSSYRGKRGSLANFVTQDAFHESLALAEIILTSEGGQQTRLNQWREMLQDRIYGRDDLCHHSGNGHQNGGHQNGHHNGDRHNGDRQNGYDRDRRQVTVDIAAIPAAAPVTTTVTTAVTASTEPAAEAVPAVSQPERSSSESEAPARKLSRSARRRRNKRLRRTQQDSTPREAESGDKPEAAAVADAKKPAAEAAPEAAKAPAPAKAASQEKPADKRRSRKTEEAKAEEKPKRPAARRGRAAAKPEPEPEAAEDAPPPKPLTAAAFWKEPEPEPEPEPEVAAEPEKKKRGRKPKAESAAKTRGKGKAAKEEAEAKPEAKPEPKPLAMDKADEAEIPMHWLDEI